MTGTTAGAEGGAERIGRGEEQGIGSGAVAVGHDHRGARVVVPVISASSSPRIQQRAVTGDEQHPRRAELEGPGDAVGGRLVVSELIIVDDHRRRSPRRSAGLRGRWRRRVRVRSPLPGAGRRARQRTWPGPGRPGRGPQRVSQTLLGLVKGLDGEDGEGLGHGPVQASERAKSRVCWATTRRRPGYP